MYPPQLMVMLGDASATFSFASVGFDEGGDFDLQIDPGTGQLPPSSGARAMVAFRPTEVGRRDDTLRAVVANLAVSIPATGIPGGLLPSLTSLLTGPLAAWLQTQLTVPATGVGYVLEVGVEPVVVPGAARPCRAFRSRGDGHPGSTRPGR